MATLIRFLPALARSGAALIAASTLAAAQFDPHLLPARPGVPEPQRDLDVRLDEAGRTQPFARTALSVARDPVAIAARALSLRKLADRVPGLAVDDHEVFGTPAFVRSTFAFLTPPVADGADAGERVVRDFLEEYRGLFEVPPGELLRSRLSRDFRTAHNGLRHLTWKQQIDGVDVQGCELRANVTERGELLNVASTLLPRGGVEFATSPVVLTDAQALRAAAASVGIALRAEPVALGAPDGPARRRAWTAAGDLRANEPATTELLYFPRTRTDVRAAWFVVVPEIGMGNTYEVTVDASSGEVLRRTNRLKFAGGSQPITFRVYPHESPAPGSPGTATPNGFQFPAEPQQLVNVSAASVAAWSPEGWIADGQNETLGNNCDAHLDLDANDVADLPRPRGTPFRTFDFPIDLALPPSDRQYQGGVVTQLFYLSNRYHDRMYSLGFDEAASNFQQVNLSGLGIGGDRIEADAQDGSGTNNANFGTAGSDGSPGRMQMYVFTGPIPDHDGDLDSDIVYHELTHGLSIRLTDGTVNGAQAGGMGEGWGDFVGLCMSSEPGDDPGGIYTVGGWTTLQLGTGYVDNYYFGIRRFPYTTDPNRNPQTYADIDPAQELYPPGVPRNPLFGGPADEVHNVGEVWCNTLWKCRANLIAAHGWAVGNEMVLQLVVDGLKLCPSTPNFLQSRDAILQADLVASGGANLTTLWAGFASKGMGLSATSPPGSTSAGLVEAFDTPNQVLFRYPNGRPTQLVTGQAAQFPVEVLGLGATSPVPGTGQLVYSVNGGSFATVAMTQSTSHHYVATLPPLACLDQIRWYVTVGTNQGPRADPPGAPVATYAAASASAWPAVYADDFETEQGWAPANGTASSGFWKRAVPVNDPGWGYDPVSDADGSGKCWVTDNQPGNTDVDGGFVQLTSRAFDFSSPTASISYRWFLSLSVADGVDSLSVQMSTAGAGGPWIPIATHDTDTALAWRTHEFSAVDAQALGISLTSNARLRFLATDAGASSVVEAGVDAFRVTRAVCLPPVTTFCFGDGSGAACPCGNPGGPGEGCASSLGHGATVSSTGFAIVAADTLVLTGAGMPNSSALYFQGTTQGGGGLGVPFGDGLRCAAGTILRLGTKSNQGGSSSYPVGGDLPVSVRGLVPASGGLRHYQCWYRNAAAFCTSSTFNLTNGLSVSWVP